ncbi:heavy metal-binding domain-containing protein [Kineococcus sp. GCM10028916]|uniref:heavy metal-binding domain-containing protein n=1 Tax=Kineococcus sp. GCM10028916 TaxID=3273394 RepID=UPI0036355031
MTTGDPGGLRNGSGPYVRAVDAAWHGALDRMLAEARALGADGVVGVRTTRAHLDGTAVEFTARGTAVRELDRTAPGTLWCAGLSAEDVAAAMGSGFAPRALVRGLSVATKHEDPLMVQQRSSWSGNEVDGLTELLTRARADARRGLTPVGTGAATWWSTTSASGPSRPRAATGRTCTPRLPSPEPCSPRWDPPAPGGPPPS